MFREELVENPFLQKSQTYGLGEKDYAKVILSKYIKLTFLLCGFSGASQEDSVGQNVSHKLDTEALFCCFSTPS